MSHFIGKGRIFVGLKSGGVKRRIGNTSAFSFQAETNRLSVLDFENAGGGEAASLERVTAITASATLREFSAANLALVLYGTTAAVAAGTVTDEEIVSSEGGLTRTASIIDTSASVTVTSDPAGTTYVAGTDYTVSPAGIVTLAAGDIGDATDLLISYTKLAVDVIQAFVNAQQAYVITIDGLNEANSGKPVVIDIHNAKIGATSGLPVISGDDFGELPVNITCEKDTAIVGAGLSQFLTISQQA